jgi:hypothetical protein
MTNKPICATCGEPMVQWYEHGPRTCPRCEGRLCNDVNKSGKPCRGYRYNGSNYCKNHYRIECDTCHLEFVPEDGETICEVCFSAHYNDPDKWCQAINDNGRQCRQAVAKGQHFCQTHLAQGYGLFNLAVAAARRDR